MLRWILVFALLVDVGLARAADKPVPAASASASVSGKVLEVKDVDNYTYLRLKTRDGEVWAAVSRAPVKTGADVTIVDANVMQNFESRTLNRKFDRIVFGSLAGSGATAATAGGDLGALHAGVARPAETGDIKVAKATGPDARTVAEVVTRRAELKDKPALVRGKVVKFTPAVMGKNWIHLRDGTGSAADGSNDVVVTTRDETKVGDVVLVKGVVRTDRDLGSGYSYKVLIEEASLQK
ncbi:MAG: nucleotide-binding protein [Betaproteobacteria bacterium]|nr:nucleotide-binding protein [Betaproteobacteria bacterium]